MVQTGSRDWWRSPGWTARRCTRRPDLRHLLVAYVVRRDADGGQLGVDEGGRWVRAVPAVHLERERRGLGRHGRHRQGAIHATVVIRTGAGNVARGGGRS